MKATGIVRRIDDLGRVVIPKEIRRTMGIKENDALEIFTEDKMICFKKYEVSHEDFAEKCAKWVSEHGSIILGVNYMIKNTQVMFKTSSGVIVKTVTLNPNDKFDMNIAICYAAKKCGFTMFDGFED